MGFTVVAKKSADVAPMPEFPEIAPFDVNTAPSFSDMADSADKVLGRDLIGGKDNDVKLESLERVPFLITSVTFRPSFRSLKNPDVWNAYVSVEAVIADASYLAACGRSLEGKPFAPGDTIVFNDGSTGIYRQIVEYLEAKGYVTLADGPKTGGMEKSRFDAPPSEWLEVHYGETSFPEGAPEGFLRYKAEIRLLCPRGLRTSDYTNDFTDDGTTHYIA